MNGFQDLIFKTIFQKKIVNVHNKRIEGRSYSSKSIVNIKCGMRNMPDLD